MAKRSTGVIHHIGTFLLFISWVLLLVVSISAPVVNDISMLKVTLTNVSGDGRNSAVTYGTFGHCVLDVKTADGSDQDDCSKSTIGYPIAAIQTAADKTEFSHASHDTLDALTNVMILHPIACAVAFIAFAFAAGAGFCGSLLASLVAFVAWIIVLVVMVIDFIIFGTVKDHVNSGNTGTGSHAAFGPAMWLVLAAFILLFFAVIIVFFSCCSRRRESKRDRMAQKEMTTTTTHRRKRFGLF